MQVYLSGMEVGMGTVRLSDADVGALEGASRLLLSPLDHQELDDWRVPVANALGELLGADRTTFILPLPGEVVSYSEGNSPLSPEFVTDYLDVLDRFEDQFELWAKQRRLGAFCRRQLYTDEVYRSSYYRDWIVPVRAYDSIGIGLEAGESPVRAIVLMHHDRPTGPRFGSRGLALVRLLLPAFRTGVEARVRLGHHARRLGAFIDRITEPLVIVNAEGQTVHRNQAVDRLISADPHGSRVAHATEELARGLGPGLRPAGNGRDRPLEPERTLRTRLAGYRLSGFAPPEELKGDGLVVVRITRIGDQRRIGDQGREIDAALLRERYGLTRQEVVVARLLADRRTNTEIAKALSISPHTARHHTEHVRNKLGVTSRREVAGRVFIRRQPEAGEDGGAVQGTGPLDTPR